MQPIRVLIAEDEPPVARFIQKLTERAGPFRIVAVCVNGEEALEAIERLRPEILITDIQMPGMNGLSLIRRATAIVPDLQSVIISGYKMFEYAQEALRLGAVGYITKPIDPVQFHLVLHKLSSVRLLEQSLERGKMLTRALQANDADAICEIVGHPFYRIAALYCCGDTDDYTDGFQSLPSDVIQAFYRDMFVMVSGIDSPEQPPSAETDKLFAHLKDIPDRSSTYMRILEARPTEEIGKQIHIDYRNLRKLAVPGVSVSVVCEKSADAVPDAAYGDEACLQRVESAIYAKDLGRIRSGISSLFDVWQQKHASVYHVKLQLRNIAELLQHSGLLSSGTISATEFFDDSIRYSSCFDDICADVLSFIQDCFQTQSESNLSPRRDSRMIFEQIVRLIRSQQVKNYSLQEISYRFDVSQPYIRKIFRQYTGKSYKEYVLDANIERAKDLMRQNPQILVKDVAEQLGFEQMYFSTVFSKTVGMTPSQYRDKLLRET